MMQTTHKSALGLDVGNKRVGIAAATIAARLPHPHTTLERGDTFLDALSNIIEAEDAGILIVGLPRGLDGQQTSQTELTQQFIEELRQRFDLPIYTQDEALTSRQAVEELESRGRPYAKGDIDALAATYILKDWLDGQG